MGKKDDTGKVLNSFIAAGCSQKGYVCLLPLPTGHYG
jgi:hypothetical protein